MTNPWLVYLEIPRDYYVGLLFKNLTFFFLGFLCGYLGSMMVWANRYILVLKFYLFIYFLMGFGFEIWIFWYTCNKYVSNVLCFGRLWLNPSLCGHCLAGFILFLFFYECLAGFGKSTVKLWLIWNSFFIFLFYCSSKLLKSCG